MSDCPCCSNILLRQLRSHQVVWFCRHCWQEMPNVSAMTGALPRHSRQVSQPTRQASQQTRPISIPSLVPQFATLSSIQHHPLAAAYLTPSMPAALTIVPASPSVLPAPAFCLSLVPDSDRRPSLATA
jgi:hypothetical protein